MLFVVVIVVFIVGDNSGVWFGLVWVFYLFFFGIL